MKVDRTAASILEYKIVGATGSLVGYASTLLSAERRAEEAARENPGRPFYVDRCISCFTAFLEPGELGER